VRGGQISNRCIGNVKNDVGGDTQIPIPTRCARNPELKIPGAVSIKARRKSRGLLCGQGLPGKGLVYSYVRQGNACRVDFKLLEVCCPCLRPANCVRRPIRQIHCNIDGRPVLYQRDSAKWRGTTSARAMVASEVKNNGVSRRGCQ